VDSRREMAGRVRSSSYREPRELKTKIKVGTCIQLSKGDYMRHSVMIIKGISIMIV